MRSTGAQPLGALLVAIRINGVLMTLIAFALLLCHREFRNWVVVRATPVQ